MLISEYHKSGGHESVINYISQHLGKIGHNVVIGSFSFKTLPPQNISHIRLKRNPFAIRTELENFDIIHNHQTINNYYSIALDKPFIFHYHGTSSKLQEANLWASFLLCKRKISEVIAVSHSSLIHLKNIVGPQASKIPSKVITNGVDSAFYTLNLPRPYKQGHPQLLFVGNLYKHKNIIKLINEMPSVLAKYPNAHLQIVGAGKDYHRLRSCIQKYSLEKRVDILGNSSREELRLMYSSCDVYVSASIKEAFVLPPMEAMACGKPVLLSNIPPHHELISLSGAGVVFSLYKRHDFVAGINKIYANLRLLQDAARRYSEANDWKMVSQKISDIYSDIGSGK